MNIISRCGKVIKRYPLGAKLANVLRSFGILNLLHDLVYVIWLLRGKPKNDFAKFYEFHLEQFNRVRELLNDQFSRETYDAIISYRINHNRHALKRFDIKPQYFLKDILSPKQDHEIFINGGACKGDSSIDFLNLFNESKNYYMYLWECDPKNIETIHARLSGEKGTYTVIPLAMWNEKAILSFKGGHNEASTIDVDGDVSVNADSIDNIHANDEISFIKMDIEGSEVNALYGAERLIKRLKPKLAICIYHKYEDLYEIPLLIKSMVPEYKIYIRHHSDRSNETVCYATV